MLRPLCGFKRLHSIRPEWVALDTSRGIDDETLKLWMRWTVIVSEALIFAPGVWFLVKALQETVRQKTSNDFLQRVSALLSEKNFSITQISNTRIDSALFADHVTARSQSH